MERFIQLVIDGIAIGSIYGALALALVLIFRSTGIVNFAQGEMAMFSTFGAWALVQAGLPLGVALLGALAGSFIGGMVIERVIIRPVEGEDPLTILIVTLGLAPLLVRELFTTLRTIKEEEGTAMLVVEQNANLVLDFADHAYVLETGRLVLDGSAKELAADEGVRRSYLGMA